MGLSTNQRAYVLYLMKTKGITQADLARKLGSSNAAIAQAMRDNDIISLELRDNVAKALGFNSYSDMKTRVPQEPPVA